MNAPTINLDTEIIDLTEMQDLAATVFKDHCSEMVTDTMHYLSGINIIFTNLLNAGRKNN